MRIFAIIIAAVIAASTFDITTPALSRSIDLGIVKIPLPSSKRYRSRSSRRNNAYASHARWYIVEEGTTAYATNDHGIWIGYDERGEWLIHVEYPAPLTAKPQEVIATQLEVNGRFYESFPVIVATENAVQVRGLDVERILPRLRSGRTIRFITEGQSVETHLKGSSAALKRVESGARQQRRLFAQGLVQPREERNRQQAAGNEQTANPEVIEYFVPGTRNVAPATVTYDIVEVKGLQLFINFNGVADSMESQHVMPVTPSETLRIIRLIEKAEKWTKIALENRVGLFSKRLGYIDDMNGDAVDLPDAIAAAAEQTGDEQTTGEPGGTMPRIDQPVKVGESAQSAPADTASGDTDTREAEALFGKSQPKDFKAANFNSYENGYTSVQLEHSVNGFSKRFNFGLTDALKLSARLQETLDQASFRLENRDFDLDEKDKLFQ